MNEKPLIDPSRPVRTRNGLQVRLNRGYVATPGDPRVLSGTVFLQNGQPIILTWTWRGEWNHEGEMPTPWDLVNLTDEERTGR